MEHFSYKDECDVLGYYMHISAFKKQLAWATDKQFWKDQDKPDK